MDNFVTTLRNNFSTEYMLKKGTMLMKWVDAGYMLIQGISGWKVIDGPNAGTEGTGTFSRSLSAGDFVEFYGCDGLTLIDGEPTIRTDIVFLPPLPNCTSITNTCFADDAFLAGDYPSVTTLSGINNLSPKYFKNFPNLTFLSWYRPFDPIVDTVYNLNDLSVFTKATFIGVPFSTRGNVEDFCECLKTNGKLNGTITLQSNLHITYNYNNINYDKNYTITFNNGDYTVSVPS